MLNQDKFLYSQNFSWDLNALEILSPFAPDTVERIDSIFRLLLQNEYQFENDDPGAGM